MNPFENIDQKPQHENQQSIALNPDKFNEIQDQISKGAKLQIVPPGFKGLIIKKEISEELKINIAQVTEKLTNIPAIVSQETAATANSILKQAKNLIKEIENERKKMDQVLNDEKADNKNIEVHIVSHLTALAQYVNKKITDYQVEEDRKARERAAELQRKKDEELRLAQLERDRVASIKNKILQFENSVNNAIASATIGTIDTLIDQLSKTSIKEDVYQEFTGEAQLMYNLSKTKLETRKNELIRLDELEKQNKAQADELRKQAEQRAEEERKRLAEIQERNEEEKQRKELEDKANIQMSHELKTSLNEGAKGVQRRWTFDEETINMALLPDEFKTYDKEAIRKAIAAGRYEIPGVNIYQKTINVSR